MVVAQYWKPDVNVTFTLYIEADCAGTGTPMPVIESGCYLNVVLSVAPSVKPDVDATLSFFTDATCETSNGDPDETITADECINENPNPSPSPSPSGGAQIAAFFMVVLLGLISFF